MDRVMFAPIMDLPGPIAIGQRLADNTMNLVPMYPFPRFQNTTGARTPRRPWGRYPAIFARRVETSAI